MEAEERRAKERVAIAKDALKWVKAGALEPQRGDYVSPKVSLGRKFEKDGQKQLRDVVIGKCEVCAIGAMFLAKAVRYDNVILKELWGHSHYKLEEHFSREQLALVECAFEKIAIGPFSGYTSTTQRMAAVGFGERYEDDKSRLVAILKNIIKNKGTFVP